MKEEEERTSVEDGEEKEKEEECLAYAVEVEEME